MDKLKEKFDTEVNLETPKVAYKETIKKTAKAEYKYKKQSGGRGQYGHVLIELKPLPKGIIITKIKAIMAIGIPKVLKLKFVLYPSLYYKNKNLMQDHINIFYND